MTTIQKLSLRGIRSYSDTEPQSIEFFKPLTIIVGANGSGKTTIIEALKYICTGSQPPLSDGGKSFILDPRMVGKPMVLAQIRFSFQSETDHKEYLAVRSFQLTQKKSKREFKAIESVVKVRDMVTQDTESLSQRCADIEKLVPKLMGVSKAVLENVIFVHQEDSNWPLGDAKSLKTKFDDIFNATRYTKALEAIQKHKKEKAAELKMMDQELSGLKSDMELAHLKEDRLRKTKEELAKLQAEMQSLQQQIASIEESYGDKEAQRRDSESLRARIDEFETMARMMSEEVNKAHDRMRSVYDEPDEELELSVRSSEARKIKLEARIQELTRTIQREDIEIGRNETEYAALVKRSGAVEAQEAEHARKKRDLQALGRKLIDSFGLSSSLVPDQFRLVAAALQDYLQKSERESADARASAAALDSDQEAQINQAKLRLSKLQEMKKQKTEAGHVNYNKCSKLQSEECELKSRADSGMQVEHDMSEAEQAIKDFESRQPIEQCRRKLEAMQKQADQISQTLKKLQFERKQLASQQEEFAAIKIKQRQIEEHARRLNELISNANQPIKTLPAAAAQVRSALENPAYLSSIRSLEENLSDSLAKSKSRRESSEAALKRSQAELESIDRDRNRADDRLGAADKKLSVIAASFDRVGLAESLHHPEAEFRAAIETHAQKVKNRQEDEAIINASEFLYSRFVDHAHKNQECALCKKPLATEEELKHFITEQSKKLNSTQPKEKLEANKAKLAQAIDKLRIMQSLLPQLIEYKQIAGEEIPQLKEQIEQIKTKQIEAKQKVEQSKRESAEAAEQEREYKEASEAVRTIHTEAKDLKQLRDALESDQRRLSQLAEGGRSLEVVSGECEAAERESSRLTQAMLDAQSEMSSLTAQRQRLQDRVNQLKDRMLEVAEVQSQLKAIKAQLEEIQALHPKLKQEIELIIGELKPLETTISKLEEARQQSRERENQEESTRNARLVSVRREIDQYKSVMNDVMQFEGQSSNREQSKAAIQQSKERIEAVKRQKSDNETELQKTKEDLAESEVEIRDVRANLDFRRRSKDLDTHKIKLREAKEKMKAISDVPIDQELAALGKRLAKLKEKRAETSGILLTTKKHAEQLVLELGMDKFRQIDKRYREKLIEYTTTKLAIEDLAQYYKALDLALMNFHSAKMKEINEILKDYWRSVYQGKDIDEIYIKSASEAEDARRSYTYSVMMKQGDVELEMRGRCSAGQRVIASLLIRLALADVFCLACGVLALDEPTTNLDHRNVKAFAQALNEILNKRRHQSNFQLIVITHDEHFVDEIGRRAHAEYYYRVFKNENNQSMIRKQLMNAGELE